jgi:hypothetical protein
LTYGDPFNGATVKGFPSDKIKIFCNPTDAVCKGEFVIGAGHLSYTTGGGAAWLKSIENSGPTEVSPSATAAAPKTPAKGSAKGSAKGAAKGTASEEA